jgi:[ribosomal protein S5]-alanine N-acetyltransferase
VIETPRLIIKPFTEPDAESFYELSNDNGFNLYPITKYRQPDIEAARTWIKTTAGKYGVWEKESKSLIGMGGLMPWTLDDESLIDITYRLRESSWRKGYGIELARALIEYGTQVLKLNNITATITPDNLASKKIAENLGMKFSRRITLKDVPTDLYRL